MTVVANHGARPKPLGNRAERRSETTLFGRHWATIEGHGDDWLDSPPPARRWLLDREGGGGLARGIVGMVAAPGGRGKTMALVQLALSVATGRPWLGAYRPTEPGRVVLALGEEDPGEVRRRLYYAAQGLGLDPAGRRAAASQIVAMGLAGELVGLVEADGAGRVRPTAAHAELLGRVADEEPAVVILDPLSRWAPNVESDNAAATAAVQALETFARSPGEPTVLVAHHTNKQSRREGNRGGEGSSSARGVTALHDGVRWVAELTGRTNDDLAFHVTKSNYSGPAQPIHLDRRAHGVLVQCERRAAELSSRKAALRAEKRAAILSHLREAPGSSARKVMKSVRGNNEAVLEVFNELVATGRLRQIDEGGGWEVAEGGA